MLRKDGAKVAKLSSSSTTKMAVARREILRVVYGSVRKVPEQRVNSVSGG